MAARYRFAGRLGAAAILVTGLTAGACTNDDLGGGNTSSVGATTGVGSRAAGGTGGIDTAGAKVNTDRSGSAVAPGPGQIPGTPGAAAGDSAATRTKTARP